MPVSPVYFSSERGKIENLWFGCDATEARKNRNLTSKSSAVKNHVHSLTRRHRGRPSSSSARYSSTGETTKSSERGKIVILHTGEKTTKSSEREKILTLLEIFRSDVKPPSSSNRKSGACETASHVPQVGISSSRPRSCPEALPFDPRRRPLEERLIFLLLVVKIPAAA